MDLQTIVDMASKVDPTTYVGGALLSFALKLLRLAVKHLGRIATDINSLKTTVAVIATKTDSHGERLERIEMAIFKGG